MRRLATALVAFVAWMFIVNWVIALYGAACYQIDGVQHSFSIGGANSARLFGNHCFDVAER